MIEHHMTRMILFERFLMRRSKFNLRRDRKTKIEYGYTIMKCSKTYTVYMLTLRELLQLWQAVYGE